MKIISLLILLSIALVSSSGAMTFRGKLISILSGQTLKWVVPENVSTVTISVYDDKGISIGSKELRVVKNQTFVVEAK